MTREDEHRMAAYACGKSLIGWHWSDTNGGFFWRHKGERGNDSVDVWSPFSDNEDSFKLLVSIAKHTSGDDLLWIISSMVDGDIQGTRINIFEKAVEIGKTI